jgi:hypothetical protein
MSSPPPPASPSCSPESPYLSDYVKYLGKGHTSPPAVAAASAAASANAPGAAAAAAAGPMAPTVSRWDLRWSAHAQVRDAAAGDAGDAGRGRERDEERLGRADRHNHVGDGDGDDDDDGYRARCEEHRRRGEISGRYDVADPPVVTSAGAAGAAAAGAAAAAAGAAAAASAGGRRGGGDLRDLYKMYDLTDQPETNEEGLVQIAEFVNYKLEQMKHIERASKQSDPQAWKENAYFRHRGLDVRDYFINMVIREAANLGGLSIMSEDEMNRMDDLRRLLRKLLA